MKPAEIRDLTLDQAKGKALELTKELFNLRMRHATNQLENPLKLRLLKREIARIKTVVAEKERVK